ncbi:MAG: P-loop NTPase [Pseudomonadota bacterium]
MAVLVSVASGKGGVGKSVLVSNLGLLMARLGRDVVMADLDTGSADLATLFGEFRVRSSLESFMKREVGSLTDALVPIAAAPKLRLLAGSGDSLATANPVYATKQRILRHLRELPADVVLLDIGAGVGFNQLDFFLAGDVQVVVTTPDPTALMDAYRFIKLAAMRKMVTLLSRNLTHRRALSKRDFASIAEVRTALEEEGARTDELHKVDELAQSFAPKLVLNRASRGGRVNFVRVQKLLYEYTNAKLTVLGEVPQDELVEESVRGYLPVAVGYPGSSAVLAMKGVAGQLLSECAVMASASGDKVPWEDCLEQQEEVAAQ